MNIAQLKTKAQTAMTSAVADDKVRIVNRPGGATYLCFADGGQADAVYNYLLVCAVTPPFDADKQYCTPITKMEPHDKSKDPFCIVAIGGIGLMPSDVAFSTYLDGHDTLESTIPLARSRFAQWMGKDEPFPIEVPTGLEGRALRDFIQFDVNSALDRFARVRFFEISELPLPAAPHQIMQSLPDAIAQLSPSSAPLKFPVEHYEEFTQRIRVPEPKADLARLQQERTSSPPRSKSEPPKIA